MASMKGVSSDYDEKIRIANAFMDLVDEVGSRRRHHF